MPTQDWSQIGAVRVRYLLGRIDHFASLEDAVCHIGWRVIDGLSARACGPTYEDWASAQTLWATHNQLCFVDEFGLVIPLAIVRRVAMECRLHLVDNYWGRWRPRHRRRQPWTYVFRDGPVPGIRCSRASRRGLAMRRMRTTQEIAEATWMLYDEDALDYGVHDRPCRRKLPTWWDDRPIGDWKARSWKNYRDHQWKPR
jgi:hypothetical protein